MQWIDNKYQLQYYNQPEGVPCYCEALIYPSDMMLQGLVPEVAGNAYTLAIDIYSADGNTYYNNITSFFEYYFAQMPDGRYYFNARLKSYPEPMCVHECFVLNVYVVNSSGGQVFNKWTERYCIANCCDVVRGVTFEQGGVSTGGDNPAGTGPILSMPQTPGNSCGEAYITLMSYFDCYDKFTGEYYGNPSAVVSGSAAFNYRKITNMKGVIKKMPREIKREYSLNCRLQRVESARQFQLTGYEFFHATKMEEIENMLHANHIIIENYNSISRFVEYEGGSPFSALELVSSCNGLYKLDVRFKDCNINQVFGCGDLCSTTGSAPMGMVISAEQDMSAGMYDEQKYYIGNDAESLMNYYRTRPGVTDVVALDAEEYDCDFSLGFIVYGTQLVPSSFYVGKPVATNRIFGQSVESLQTLCNQLKPACAQPVLDAVLMEERICSAATIGDVLMQEMPVENIYINGNGDWELVDIGSEATRSQNTVVVSIEVTNDNYTYDAGDPDATMPYINGQVIGYIGEAVWPSVNKIFTNANNGSLPADATLIIQTDGKIMYAGPVTSANLSGSRIELNNLTYNL